MSPGDSRGTKKGQCGDCYQRHDGVRNEVAMVKDGRMPRAIVIIGLVAMLAGVLDPLEGSIAILAGIALAALGAALGRSPNRTTMYVALALTTAGVGLLFGFSAVGGFGGNTGRSMWWALLLLPYPAGWVVGVVGAVRLLREKPRAVLPHR